MAKKAEAEVTETAVSEWVNPFAAGVTYEEFEKALNGKTPREYCAGKLDPELIAWLENDFTIYLTNKK